MTLRSILTRSFIMQIGVVYLSSGVAADISDTREHSSFSTLISLCAPYPRQDMKYKLSKVDACIDRLSKYQLYYRYCEQ